MGEERHDWLTAPTKNGKESTMPPPRDDLYNLLEMIRGELNEVKVEVAQLREGVKNFSARLDGWDKQVSDTNDFRVHLALLKQRVDTMDHSQLKTKSLYWQVWIALISSLVAPVVIHFLLRSLGGT